MGMLKERYENAQKRGSVGLMVFGWLFDIAIVVGAFLATTYFAKENNPEAYVIGIGISVIAGLWVVFETIIIIGVFRAKWVLRKQRNRLQAKTWMDV